MPSRKFSKRRKASIRPNLQTIKEVASSIERGERSPSLQSSKSSLKKSNEDVIQLTRSSVVNLKDVLAEIKPKKSFTRKLWKGIKRRVTSLF